MIKKYGLFFIGFLFCATESSAMRNAVTRSSIIEKRFSELTEESGLNMGFTSIKALEETHRENLNPDTLVEMLHDAVKNVKKMCDYVNTKEREGTEPVKVLAQLHKQKRFCVEALYELYESVKEKFEKITTEKADNIRVDLQQLGILEIAQ